MKLLEYVEPFAPLIPQLEKPKGTKVPITDKVFWTIMALLLYLVASQTPLYGIRPSETADPLAYYRALLASNRGTLMELGISPIVNSGLIMQLLTGLKMLEVNQENPRERMLFDLVQKLGGIVITIGTAFFYVFSGMYGPVADLGIGNALIIVVQLFFAGILVLLLDELLNKYGMGSGISLFIATNICEGIVWSALSPRSIPTSTGNQYQGAILNLLHLLITRSDKIVALKEAFYRPYLPNITNLMATVLVMLVVIYFQGFRVDLPIKHQRERGNIAARTYPIKLFYTSNIPIILQSALVSNLFLISQALYSRLRGNFLINILGQWGQTSNGGYSPVGGIIYYISPPQSISELVTDPIHVISYIAFMLISCAAFSYTWLEVSGSAPKDVAQQFKAQGLVIRGHREQSTLPTLKKYIPIAATFGGMCIGALTVFADFVGAIGSGTGLLLAVNIIFSMYETYIKEAQSEAPMGAIMKSILPGM